MQSRGCPLKGLAGTPDLAAHRQRFTANGWQRAEALDMDTIHRCHLDPLERHRRAPATPLRCGSVNNRGYNSSTSTVTDASRKVSSAPGPL